MRKTLLSSMILSSVIALSGLSFAETMDKTKHEKLEHKVETKLHKVNLKDTPKMEKKSDKKLKMVNTNKKLVSTSTAKK